MAEQGSRHPNVTERKKSDKTSRVAFGQSQEAGTQQEKSSYGHRVQQQPNNQKRAKNNVRIISTRDINSHGIVCDI